VNPYPFVPFGEKERTKRCDEVIKLQAEGLATRVLNTGIKTLVLGISGGLDSTLALLVAVEAKKLVEDIKIIGISMPNDGNTSSRTYKNSLDLIKAVGLEPRSISIQETVKKHLQDISHPEDYQGEGDQAYENAQARMRTYILMDIANMEKGMVVGTGDLSELALGWCTYNGDHMSMYGVNSGVVKTLVRYLVSNYALETENKELKAVLNDIIATPITPELTPSSLGQIQQKTEDKIGKYSLNDFFLYYHLRFGFMPGKIVALARLAFGELTKAEIKEALLRFYQRFYSQQFKRSCLPDGPKIGSVSLSPRGDYRMPSDSDYKMMIDLTENC
jgi:NAD+ synthase (glutamine-hydrolysing)